MMQHSLRCAVRREWPHIDASIKLRVAMEAHPGV